QMGILHEAVHPLHDLLQCPDPPLGPVRRRVSHRGRRGGGGPRAEIHARCLRGGVRRDSAIAAALLPLSGTPRRVVPPGDPVDRRQPTELTAMLIQHLDPLASSVFSLMAIASLLLSFVMLGSRWLKNYLYAFAAESWIIAALSATVGFYGSYPELYLIAIL